MRQRFAIIITIAVVVVLLVVLNAVSYVSNEQKPDEEFNPDRSTFNAGATGTLAFYDVLSESGRKVVRWREETQALLADENRDKYPSTFVVIGRTRIPFDEDEVHSLLKWVEHGGRLVIIDRAPDPRLLPVSDKWSVSTKTEVLPANNVHPNNSEEMTAGVAPARPSLPSTLTRDVETVMPSRFASTINISTTQSASAMAKERPTATPVTEENEDEDEEPPPPPPPSLPKNSNASPHATDYTPRAPATYNNPVLKSPAPVAQIETTKGALLVDYPHGAGRIILLSDPYIVSNGGIRLADNLQLAINVVAGETGIIAFDEYHQGRAAARNQLVAYFAGTPILWMLAQGALLIFVILWTGGRRFARPLPVAQLDRRSSLEFVASMAELQQRARAYDLAIENIYSRLRRLLVRQAGLSHNSPRSEIASRVAARSQKLNARELETLMRECEEVINGAQVDTGKALELVRNLRRVERILGLRMRSRETRQAAEGLRETTI
ncbi:MAG: hypothetical protein DMF68_10355 [Acidobacteria bacterium]|nr:MAG: hypothetical protein DMF68_10355 [Acidobacteriota bacterium]